MYLIFTINYLFLFFSHASFLEKGVFGIALKDSLKYAYACISYVDDATKTYHYGAVPIVVAKCGSFVKNEGEQTRNRSVLP